MKTTDPLYDETCRYRITLKDPTELNTIYTYDGFNAENSPFALTDVNVNLAVGQTSDFSFGIDDTKDRVIKDTIDCGYICIVEAGKQASEYRNIAYGIIDSITDDYPAGNQIKYKFEGLGFGVILNYTYLNFIKSANKEDITDPSAIANNPDFQLDKLALEAFQNADYLPVRNSLTLEQRGGFDTSQLLGSTRVITSAVNQPYSTASAILENFAAESGTVLWVGPNKEVLLRPPHRQHSGITIRQWSPDRKRDRADTTSYYYGGWSSQKLMKVDSGFFNRVFLTVNVDDVINTSSGDVTANFLSLANKDIAQQFIPGSTKLFNIALLLAKKGTGKSSVEDAYNLTGVHGLICKDNGSNQPSDKIVATFIIPYDQIDETPTPVYNINLQYFVSNIEPTTKHWIILFKTGIDEDNTVVWYNDADYITDSTTDAPRWSAVKQPFTEQPTPDKQDFSSGFATSSKGPVFKFTFFATKTTTLEVSDPISIAKYTPKRPVEIRVNAPWIRDVNTGFRYANTLLQYGSKLKRVFDKKQVSIPTNLFFPLQLVSIVYPLAGLDSSENIMAEINSVNYSASGGDLEHPLGSDFVNLTATGYVNHWQRKVSRAVT
jgi:hypothetical protein